MNGGRAARTIVEAQLRRWPFWMALAFTTAWPFLFAWAQEQVGPWVGESSAPQSGAVGLLIGVYWGSKWVRQGSLVERRLGRGDRLAFRWVLAGFNVAALGAASWVIPAWVTTPRVVPLQDAVVSWAWASVIWTLVTTCLLSLVDRPGRCFLAAVTLVWWIPAAMPPSFLDAVPRALRQLVVGGPEFAAPNAPRAWLADTALVAGLLLLAWAPRRATPRSDEVRHPR